MTYLVLKTLLIVVLSKLCLCVLTSDRGQLWSRDEIYNDHLLWSQEGVISNLDCAKYCLQQDDCLLYTITKVIGK